MRRTLVVFRRVVVRSPVVPPVGSPRVAVGSMGATPVGDGSRAVVGARRLRVSGAHGAGDNCGYRVRHLGGGRMLRAAPMGVPPASEHALEAGERQEQHKHKARSTPIGQQASNSRDLLCLCRSRSTRTAPELAAPRGQHPTSSKTATMGYLCCPD
jgi:hypothetical protein